MKRLLSIAFVAAALCLLIAPTASAADRYHGHGGRYAGPSSFGYGAFGGYRDGGARSGYSRSRHHHHHHRSHPAARSYRYRPSYGGGFVPHYRHGHGPGHSQRLHIDIGPLHLDIRGRR